MANIEDCPGFETFGADVKAARKAKRLSRKTMAEIINVDARYLANIENDGTIPSLPVVIQLIKECGLPVERYFNPEIMREESARRLLDTYFRPTVRRHLARQNEPDYLDALRKRQIWCEGTFATQKWGHNLTRVLRRGLEAAEDHCLLSATALNLKRMIRCMG